MNASCMRVQHITTRREISMVSPWRARGNHGGKSETMPRQHSGPDNSRRNRCQRIRTRAGMVNKDGVIPYLGFPCVEAQRKKTAANGQHTVHTYIYSYITCTRYTTTSQRYTFGACTSERFDSEKETNGRRGSRRTRSRRR